MRLPRRLSRLTHGAAIAALLVAQPLWAKTDDDEQKVVIASGFAEIQAGEDASSARRRALADALMSAALSGEAQVTGFTAASMGAITGDFTMSHTRYRVAGHEVVEEIRSGGTWRITIKAKVAPPSEALCQSSQHFPVTAYAPEIIVDPFAPAWATAVVPDLNLRLVEQMEAHPAVTLVRALDRSRSVSNASGVSDEFSYAALTSGKIRTAASDWAFEPRIRISGISKNGRKKLQLNYEARLFKGAENRPSIVHKFTSVVGLPKRGVRDITGLLRKDRARLMADVGKGSEDFVKSMLDHLACQPLTAGIRVQGKQLIVSAGSRHGLKPGMLAYTTDKTRGSSVLMLGQIGASKTVLVPLDTQVPIGSFMGRRVEFLEIQ